MYEYSYCTYFIIGFYFAMMLMIFIKLLFCNLLLLIYFCQSNLLCVYRRNGSVWKKNKKNYWSMSWVIIVKYRIKSTYWKVGLSTI